MFSFPCRCYSSCKWPWQRSNLSVLSDCHGDRFEWLAPQKFYLCQNQHHWCQWQQAILLSGLLQNQSPRGYSSWTTRVSGTELILFIVHNHIPVVMVTVNKLTCFLVILGECQWYWWGTECLADFLHHWGGQSSQLWDTPCYRRDFHPNTPGQGNGELSNHLITELSYFNLSL